MIGVYVAARQGIAAWYARNNQPEGIRSAIKWDPGNPQYDDTLANLIHFYSENPDPNRVVTLCETATRLSPYDAHYWADLGSAYDWAGRPEGALHAFERAHQLSPNSPDVNWRLANYYVREKRVEDALPLLRSVLLAGGVPDRQAFHLVGQTGADNSAVMAEMLPPRGPVFVDYLNFQVESGNISSANDVWRSLLKSGLPFKIADSFSYFDALIRDRDIDRATGVWRELGGRFPAEIRSRSSPSNLVTNGNFVSPILNGGFDWRVNPVRGAAVRINSAGPSHEGGWLQIDFDGTQNMAYGDTLELVPVRPDTEYEFSGELRTQGVTTDSGPRFEIYDRFEMRKLLVSTANRTGDSDWVQERISFRTSPNTRLIVLRVARPASEKFDNKISGTVFIRHISLQER